MATYVADKGNRVLHQVDRLTAECGFEAIPDDDKEVVYTDASAGNWLEELDYEACRSCIDELPVPDGTYAMEKQG